MRAVNLLPADAPRGSRAREAFGRDRGAYILLVGLSVLAAMSAGWALTHRQLTTQRATLANVQAEAAAASAKADEVQVYTSFAALRTARVETVTSLIDGRFDWAHSLHEVARVIPDDVSLISLIGTVSPTAAVTGGGGNAQRAGRPVPALDLIGCARTQSDVAKLLVRLRKIDGVDHVTLASSAKSDSAGANDTDCRANDRMPQFALTVFYAAPDGISPAEQAVAGGGAAAAASGETR